MEILTLTLARYSRRCLDKFDIKSQFDSVYFVVDLWSNTLQDGRLAKALR